MGTQSESEPAELKIVCVHVHVCGIIFNHSEMKHHEDHRRARGGCTITRVHVSVARTHIMYDLGVILLFYASCKIGRQAMTILHRIHAMSLDDNSGSHHFIVRFSFPLFRCDRRQKGSMWFLHVLTHRQFKALFFSPHHHNHTPTRLSYCSYLLEKYISTQMKLIGSGSKVAILRCVYFVVSLDLSTPRFMIQRKQHLHISLFHKAHSSSLTPRRWHMYQFDIL